MYSNEMKEWKYGKKKTPGERYSRWDVYRALRERGRMNTAELVEMFSEHYANTASAHSCLRGMLQRMEEDGMVRQIGWTKVQRAQRSYLHEVWEVNDEFL